MSDNDILAENILTPNHKPKGTVNIGKDTNTSTCVQIRQQSKSHCTQSPSHAPIPNHR